ncbi:MAG: sodium:solute symporter family protein [Actinobacteria bacterium]|nr:sodium:solute symporter family protein [Actinomycetota bacterium]
MSSAAIVFWVVIAVSLLLAAASRYRIGVIDLDQYLVARRNFAGPLLFFLAVGEIYSIGTMIGLPGGIYAEGTSYGMWFLGYILLAYPIGYFLGPLISRAAKKYNSLTVPDVFRSHYHSRALEIASSLAAIGFLLGWAELNFTGLEAVFSAVGLRLTSLEMVFIAIAIAYIYIIVSGVRSNAFVAIMKDVFMIGGIAIVGITVAVVAPGGVSHIFVAAAQHHVPSTVQGSALTYAMTTIGMNAVAFYLGVTTFLFTARSEATVKRTQIPMPLYMLMYPLLAFASYYAIERLPHLKVPDQALLSIAHTVLPSWALGIVVAGAGLAGVLVLAAFSLFLGPIVSRNLIPNAPRTAQIRWVNVTIAIFLIVAAVLAAEVPTLMLNLLALAYYFEIQVVPAWLLLMFGSRVKISGAALSVGVLAGIGMVIGLYVSGATFYSINPGLIAVVVNVAVAIVANVVLRRVRQVAVAEPAISTVSS